MLLPCAAKWDTRRSLRRSQMFIKFGTTRVRLNHISVISDPFNAGESFGSYCHSVRVGLLSGEEVFARFNSEAGAQQLHAEVLAALEN
ncbi:hypothetical protein XcodCFBP4690_00890 [Xanthomonas codiaei]|uniref:Uncharacterized protein n=2 Tax=Xanthomonas codiaei TaxID=56463 RepID=A0A2S7CZ45_9XANT|nr:hypothetical protein XcodCFBP4690_00890 [Xanthomonas codiaei]